MLRSSAARNTPSTICSGQSIFTEMFVLANLSRFDSLDVVEVKMRDWARRPLYLRSALLGDEMYGVGI